MNGAESLLRTLVGSGVEVCFGNPGTSEMHFVAALDKVEGMRAILGLFEGAVRRFPPNVRLPHMGWNQIEARPDSRLLNGLSPETYVIFMHSYYAPEVTATAATCTYGIRYTAALESGNIFGVQFHPEKSGPAGLRIVRNFVELEPMLSPLSVFIRVHRWPEC